MTGRKRIVIIGAGFAGLYAARGLAKQDVDVLLIDRNNFHTFTPLLYQVATCALDPSAIAYPVRSIFRDRDNIQFMLGEVVSIDRQGRSVEVRTNGHLRREAYDYLLLAAGSVTHYFGQETLAEHAFELKTLRDAVGLRHHILRLFEKAIWAEQESERRAMTTLVVVGGGPTGLETAGALYELYNHVLKLEYGERQDLSARVVLVEARDDLLAVYPEKLREAARRQLESLGVEVLTGAVVAEIAADHIRLRDGRIIPTHTVVWSAGVCGASLAGLLDVPLQPDGRIPVEPTLQVKGCEDVYAAGDIAYLQGPDGQPYPMLIPVAKQQGILVARNILAQLSGRPPGDFRYVDRGIMATIGRSRAVAWIFYRFQLTGFLAWMAWLWLHLVMLMGFRNRMSVFLNWAWNYITYDRSVRIILYEQRLTEPEKQPAERE